MNEQAKNTEIKSDEQKKEIQTQQPQTMEAFLLSAQTRIDKILPSTMKDNGITPEKFILTALTEIRKNPMLATCDRASIAICIINAAELGLQVGATLGQAYLVPYSNKGKMEAQFQIGYKGLLELVRRSGKIKRISSHVVREGDQFNYCFGINEKLEHRPESDNKKITHAYALVEFLGGGHQFDVMTIDEILKIKSKSKINRI
jgi:recombination protein RecT